MEIKIKEKIRGKIKEKEFEDSEKYSTKRCDVEKYPRLLERRKTLVESIKQLPLTEKVIRVFDEEIYCIDYFFECGFAPYETISAFCKERGIKRVVDIGCAYGHQSECFLLNDIEYVGVEVSPLPYWNDQYFQYFTAHYPCPLPVKKGDLAISVLCLGWNCYLTNGEKTLISQCESLQKDFTHCLLYIPEETKDVLIHYYHHLETVGQHLYYFSNV